MPNRATILRQIAFWRAVLSYLLFNNPGTEFDSNEVIAAAVDAECGHCNYGDGAKSRAIRDVVEEIKGLQSQLAAQREAERVCLYLVCVKVIL